MEAKPMSNATTARAVAYLRRSTDHQDRSLGDQEAAVRQYAETHSLQIVEVYTDDAISGKRSQNRDAFQRMMEDAAARPKRFDLVLVYDVKRFGRMDNDETGYYRHLLRLRGVRVCYVSEGFGDGSIDDLIRPVKQWQARQESKDLAKVVIRGHVSKFQSRGGGWWMCGVPPFGYDRRYEDGAGKFLFTVRNMRDGCKHVLDADGRLVRVLDSKARLNISDVDRCRLRPSEPGRVLVVQRVLHECIENGLGCAAIAKRLNADGILTPRTEQWDPRDQGECWKYATIRNILRNPAYAGDVVWNRSTTASFYRIDRTGAVERASHECATSRSNPSERWFIARDAHPPLVSRETFDLAQELMQRRLIRLGRVSVDPHRDETDFRAHFTLTGLLECARCKNPMWGSRRGRRYLFRREKPYGARMYVCHRGHSQARVGCFHKGCVRQRVLERVVTDRIVAWYRDFLASGGQRKLRQSAVVQCRRFRQSIGRPTKARRIEGAEALVASALEFLAHLRERLYSKDIIVRRMAFRRCTRRIRVDLPGRMVTIWLRRLPVLGATAGGVVRVSAPLPEHRYALTKGPRKRANLLRYGLARHLGRKSEPIQALVQHLRQELQAIGPDVTETIHQQYIAFTRVWHFACIRVTRERVLLYLKLDPDKIRRRPPFFRDVRGIGTQTTGHVELSIRTPMELAASMQFALRAYALAERRLTH
jgi:predicted transport protein